MSLDKRPLITSVRCEVLGNHCHVTVFSRGRNTGTLVVGADDGPALAQRLVPHGTTSLDIGGRLTRWALAEVTVQRDGYKLTATQDEDDREVVRIAIDGDAVGNVRWNAPRFDGYMFTFTRVDAENEDARRELEAAYGEALANLPEPL
jgi:hypothetical protein